MVGAFLASIVGCRTATGVSLVSSTVWTGAGVSVFQYQIAQGKPAFISCVFSKYQEIYKSRMASSLHAYWYRAYSISFVSAPGSRFDKTNTPKRYLHAGGNNCSIDNKVCSWGKWCSRDCASPRVLTLYASRQHRVPCAHLLDQTYLQCIAVMRISAGFFQSHPNSAEHAHNLPVLLSVKEVRTEYMSKQYIQFRCRGRQPSTLD